MREDIKAKYLNAAFFAHQIDINGNSYFWALEEGTKKHLAGEIEESFAKMATYLGYTVTKKEDDNG